MLTEDILGIDMKPRLVLIVSLLVLAASGALAGDKTSGVPSLVHSDFTCRTTEEVSVLMCPDGDGMAISAARTFDARVVDATIDVFISDYAGYPIVLFPHEDIWIEIDGVVMPLLHRTADFHTSMDGLTEFAAARAGGGHASGQDLYVILNGDPIQRPAITNLHFNSPDLNGDLVINLIDITRFATIIHTGYDYAADFHWDGVVNMVDLVIFAQHFGHRYE